MKEDHSSRLLVENSQPKRRIKKNNKFYIMSVKLKRIITSLTLRVLNLLTNAYIETPEIHTKLVDERNKHVDSVRLNTLLTKFGDRQISGT